MLRTFLDFHRATLAMKCDGLSDEDLRRAASPPSTLSLLGSSGTWPKWSAPGSGG